MARLWTAPAPTGGEATLTVAASNASTQAKTRAAYVCDGVADEVEINAALATLPSIGGAVELSEGTFTQAAPILVQTDNTRLAGAAMGTPSDQSSGATAVTRGGTLLQPVSGYTGAEQILVQPAAANRVLWGVTLERFALNGRGFGTLSDGIRALIARSTFRDLWVYNTTGYGFVSASHTFGVLPKAAHDNLFDHIRVDAAALDGMLFLNGSTDNLLRNLIVSTCGGNAITMDDGTGATSQSTANMLVGCYLYSCTGKALAAPGYNLVVTGSRIQDCNGGIYISGLSGNGGIVISGNSFRNLSAAADNTTDAINVTPSTTTEMVGMVSGNNFSSKTSTVRYCVNLGTHASGIAIGPNSSGFESPAVAAFGTAFSNGVANPYTPTNVTTDRSYDANATSTDELADVVGTLIADLRSKGMLS